MRRSKPQQDMSLSTQMTPMIDIVFQLLVFFIMTFKITTAEGDFDIKMPLGGDGPPADHVALRLRLAADANGELARAELNGEEVASWDELHLRLMGIVGSDRGPGSAQEQVEVTLACDSELRYKHTMDAITAVSGHRDSNGNLVPLVERISFDR